MANSSSKTVVGNNNLELYLNHVFEKECKIKASEEEEEFIRTGIEHLARKIVDLTLDLISDDMSNVIHREGEEDQFQKSLEEIYFPIKKEKPYVEVKTAKSPIIKVGSFYEGTKNNFPDEFDIIYLLYLSRASSETLLTLGDASSFTLLFTPMFHHHVMTVTDCDREFLKYGPDGKQRLYFDRFVVKHGPASMLRFIYCNGSGKQRNIHLDLVPAYKRLLNKDNMANYDKNRKNDEKQESFHQAVLAAKDCLYVEGCTSFTHIEKDFMKNVLSRKHLKVYRVLKFLITGHGDSETLHLYQKQINTRVVIEFKIGVIAITGYSSYQIKTMMIYHHDDCTNSDTDDMGPCVLQVLEAMCKYKVIGEFPTLLKFELNKYPTNIRLCLRPYLESLTQTLRSMQDSEDQFDYEKVKMKSVARQYLDHLDRNDKMNAKWFKYLDTLGRSDPNHASLKQFLDDERERESRRKQQYWGCQIL